MNHQTIVFGGLGGGDVHTPVKLLGCGERVVGVDNFCGVGFVCVEQAIGEGNATAVVCAAQPTSACKHRVVIDLGVLQVSKQVTSATLASFKPNMQGLVSSPPIPYLPEHRLSGTRSAGWCSTKSKPNSPVVVPFHMTLSSTICCKLLQA